MSMSSTVGYLPYNSCLDIVSLYFSVTAIVPSISAMSDLKVIEIVKMSFQFQMDFFALYLEGFCSVVHNGLPMIFDPAVISLFEELDSN